jgi:hypothetical protein
MLLWMAMFVEKWQSSWEMAVLGTQSKQYWHRATSLAPAGSPQELPAAPEGRQFAEDRQVFVDGGLRGQMAVFVENGGLGQRRPRGRRPRIADSRACFLALASP